MAGIVVHVHKHRLFLEKQLGFLHRRVGAVDGVP